MGDTDKKDDLPKGCAAAILGGVVLVIAMYVLGSRGDDAPEGTNPATVDRLEALTDCDELQFELDRFVAIADGADKGSSRRTTANHYIVTVGDRMDALNCH